MKTHWIKPPSLKEFEKTWTPEQGENAIGRISVTLQNILDCKGFAILQDIYPIGDPLIIELEDRTEQSRVPCTVQYEYIIQELDSISVLAKFKSRTINFDIDA